MDNDLIYVGFWKRTVAVLVDTVLIILVTIPILIWVYGIDYLNNEHVEKGSLDFIINYFSMYDVHLFQQHHLLSLHVLPSLYLI